jgi:hypothetical protein
MSTKNFSDATGNRNRDLPTCSAVPQPTKLPRVPHILHILHIIHIGILKTNRIIVPDTVLCLFVYQKYLCLINATSFTSNLKTGFLHKYNLNVFRPCRRSGSTAETRPL